MRPELLARIGIKGAEVAIDGRSCKHQAAGSDDRSPQIDGTARKTRNVASEWGIPGDIPGEEVNRGEGPPGRTIARHTSLRGEKRHAKHGVGRAVLPRYLAV